jgi:hypothetical protein
MTPVARAGAMATDTRARSAQSMRVMLVNGSRPNGTLKRPPWISTPICVPVDEGSAPAAFCIEVVADLEPQMIGDPTERSSTAIAQMHIASDNLDHSRP